MRTYLSITVFLLVVDRLLKMAALQGLLSGSFWFFGYPRFTFHKNFGIAFDLPAPPLAIIIFSSLLILILAALLIREIKIRGPHLPGFMLLVSGALGNLIDRIRYGFVIDVIEIFPRSVWNLADGMILIGCLFLIFRPRIRSRG